MSRPKSKTNAFLIAGLILLVLAAAWLFFGLRPVSAAASAQAFVISPGTGFRDIGRALQGAGLIRSALAFEAYAVLTNRAAALEPGRYELSPSESGAAISRTIVAGPELEATVTIPEGTTDVEIDRILSSAGVTAPGAFLKLAEAQHLEGHLFPDTYDFYFNSDPQTVINKFLADFDQRAAPLLTADPANAARNLILASILEKEVPTLADREIVAGILIKRVAAGIPLQVDASICYIKEELHPADPCYPLTTLDKEIQSPYNTYLHSGWPPAPIANPGALAIQAALHPAESPYWYYLSDPKSGKTIFAKTLAEQVANQLTYLKN